MTAKNKKEVWFWEVFVFIFRRYADFPFWAITGLLGRVVSIVLGLLPAVYYADLIDIISDAQIASQPIAQHAIGVLMVIFGIKLFNNSLIFRLYDYAIVKLEMAMQQKLYNEIFGYLHQHSYQYFIDNFSGTLVSQIRKMTWALERFTDMLTWNVLPFFLNVILIVVIVGRESWAIALGILLFILVFSAFQYRVTSKLQPYQEAANELDSDLGGLLSDTIGNALTVKTFAALDRESKKFADLNAELTKARTKQFLIFNRIRTCSLVAVVFLEVGALRYAIRMRGEGALAVGMIVLVQNYVLRVIDQIIMVGSVFRQFSRTVSEVWEGLAILQTPRAIQDAQNALSLDVKKAEIRFHDVDFAYGEEKIFQKLSFEIKSGEHIALVWASGSGKSTITKLLLRFYDLQKGQILIDGQDIAAVSQESLRRHISLVPQDPVLFHRSIKENIAYARPDASDQEIYAAAKMARCDVFIEKLEKQYDTLVGERGIKLSWGERQRIAIARAILENAPILIMDEATSALDSESEKYIQEAMQEVMKNKTTIVIAHRLSTIMKMDRIIVMDKWKIAETWTHTQLLQNPQGIYHKLRNIQSWGFIWDGDKE